MTTLMSEYELPGDGEVDYGNPLSPEESLDEDEFGEDIADGYSPAERPWGVSAWGVTSYEESRHESLGRRLAREQRELTDEPEGDGIGDSIGTDGELKIINGGCYRNGPNSSPVPTWKPTRSSGRYCIRLRRVFTSAASSARVCLVRLASDRFRCAQTGSTGLGPGAEGGSRYTVNHGRAAISSAIAALTWVLRLSQTSTMGPPSCWWAASRRAA